MKDTNKKQSAQAEECGVSKMSALKKMTKYYLVIQNRQTGERKKQIFCGPDCTREDALFVLDMAKRTGMGGGYDRHTEKIFIQETEN